MSKLATSLRFKSLVWWGAVVVGLAIGYGDLWIGGLTIGPAMLVLTYCVLIPIAILRS